jgi:hypothetical protein
MDDSLMVLANALHEHVIGKQLVAKLETPDFVDEGDHALLQVTDAFGKRDARLVNAGGTKLRFTLAQFPDQGLYVFPGPGPSEIGAAQTHTLQFALAFGATANEYDFVLTSSASDNRTVVVRFPKLETVQHERQRAAQAALTILSDPVEFNALMASPAPDSAAVVEVARRAVTSRSPGLSEAGQYVLAAELLDAVNWPDLAAEAIRAAVQAQPEVINVPSVLQLKVRAERLSGQSDGGVKPGPGSSLLPGLETPFTTLGERRKASKVVALMRDLPSLKALSQSLKGDLSLAAGDRKAAADAYRTLSSPSAALRLEATEKLMPKPQSSSQSSSSLPNPGHQLPTESKLKQTSEAATEATHATEPVQAPQVNKAKAAAAAAPR